MSTTGAVPIELTTPLGAGKLQLRTLHGEERLSGLFRYNLELVSADDAIDFAQLVGKPMTVSLALASGEKNHIHGVVGRFMQAGKSPRFTTYYADLYPWLWLLTMHSDCRIFQNKSVPDIVKAVFSDLGFTDVKDSLTATYQPREYCVQYMETTFDFVSRLLEEEGIGYFFTHTESAHTLVLCDDSSAWQPCPGLATLHMRGALAGWEDESSLTECTLEQRVVPGEFKTDDYDFEKPALELLATATAEDNKRSLYEFPGGYITKDKGDAIVSRLLASYEVNKKVLRATSACRAVHAGSKFKLEGHSRADVNTDYYVRSMSLRADQSTVYTNSLECVPLAVPYRPLRNTPKPKILGAQTATVVGKKGEEIWTDQYGRVKLHFHWDQKGKQDENDSCWVRVAQGWAGKQWGAFFLPRVGQEVLVTFLDGNPDRPLVTGSVYNAIQKVPYALPANQTKSTIKSSTSKGGSGYNEICFEDKKGSEEIIVHAQKDMTTTVLGDQTLTVTKNRKVTVDKEHETLILNKGNRSVNVKKGNETHKVKGTRKVEIKGKETHENGADYEAKVKGNFKLKVDGNITIEAGGNVILKAGKNLNSEAGQALTNKSGTSLTNKAGTTLENNAGVSMKNKASAQQEVDGGGMLILKGGMVKIN